MGYPKQEYTKGGGQAVLTCNRTTPTAAKVRVPLPGNIVIVHGVNDVGVSFGDVERGLCAGLEDRLGWKPGTYQAAAYRIPETDDRGKLEKDPDAVFFKRQIDENTYSPVIPFYWGFSEDKNQGGTRNGQRVDRFGNRLDKDLTKGGGPFANATTTLPDMWAPGAPYFGGAADAKLKDPLRPVLAAPGHMYMVLAAQRLANLANVIRAYDPNEVVSVVAHSQGCMVSLLAQAFLLQAGQRPIDTLVLTHPPYSLEEPLVEGITKSGEGGQDPGMKEGYAYLSSGQTLNARLQTLVRIANGVEQQRNTTP